MLCTPRRGGCDGAMLRVRVLNGIGTRNGITKARIRPPGVAWVAVHGSGWRFGTHPWLYARIATSRNLQTWKFSEFPDDLSFASTLVCLGVDSSTDATNQRVGRAVQSRSVPVHLGESLHSYALLTESREEKP